MERRGEAAAAADDDGAEEEGEFDAEPESKAAAVGGTSHSARTGPILENRRTMGQVAKARDEYVAEWQRVHKLATEACADAGEGREAARPGTHTKVYRGEA